MTVRMLDMAGTVADCTQAVELIEGIEAEHLLADQGYDTSKALAVARSRGMAPVSPSKGNRKVAQEYDAALYQARHLVENAFVKLKEWRGVATRYAKNAASYLAICQIRALALRAKIIQRHALDTEEPGAPRRQVVGILLQGARLLWRSHRTADCCCGYCRQSKRHSDVAALVEQIQADSDWFCPVVCAGDRGYDAGTNYALLPELGVAPVCYASGI